MNSLSSDKEHFVISFHYKNDNLINNDNNEKDMLKDLTNLAKKWMKEGYIKDFIVADEEIYSRYSL